MLALVMLRFGCLAGDRVPAFASNPITLCISFFSFFLCVILHYVANAQVINARYSTTPVNCSYQNLPCITRRNCNCVFRVPARDP